MTERQRVGTGTVWEERYGYCRALRVGNLIFVSGTTAANEAGEIVGGDDAEAQTRFIIQKIERAMAELGGSLQDVVRTRTFLTNKDDWEAVARAHQHSFGAVRPVSTLVEVSALIAPGYLVEMEVDAVVGDDQ